MEFIIRGKSYEINRGAIIQATKDVTPKEIDGRNKYYVELHGLRFPVKQPIHLVTGLPYTGGFITQDARRILPKLNFKINHLKDEHVLSFYRFDRS